MISAIRVPSLDASTTNATLVRMLVTPGHHVNAGDCVAEIETEKTTFPVESPWSGKIEKILAAVSEELAIGAPLMAIQTDDTSATPFDEAVAPPDASQTQPSTKTSSLTQPPLQAAATPTVYAHLYGCTQPKNVLFNAGMTATNRIPPPLTYTAYTGEKRAGEKDVRESESAEDRETREKKLEKEALTKFAARQVPIHEVRPLTGSALRTQQRMLCSARQIPTSSVCLPIEIASLRERLQVYRAATRQLIHPSDAILWAAATALKNFPEFNAYRNGEELHLYGQINLGLVYDIKGELMLPSILNADQLSLPDFALELRSLYKDVTARTLPMNRLGVATFVTSNLFGSGATHAHPIVNAGNSAVLLIGTPFQQGLSDESGLRFVEHVHLILGFDHTIINGMKASAFLRNVKKQLDTLTLETESGAPV